MKIERRKWKEYYDLPILVEARKKIIETYSNKLIFIEETHQYFLDVIELMPVSYVGHKFKRPFPAKERAEQSAKRYGGTAQDFLDKWKAKADNACARGTDAHEFGESYFYYMIGEDDKILPSCKNKVKNGVLTPTNKREEAVVKFWNDLPECFIPVLSEARVFNEKAKYAGTFDILFYYHCVEDDSKSGFLVFDYKTNEDLFKNFMGQKLLYPFHELLDMPLNLYKIQLSLYQIPIEDIGLKVIGRRIIWMKDDGTYDKINLESYTDLLRKNVS